MTLGMALDEEFVVEDGVSRPTPWPSTRSSRWQTRQELEVIFVDNYDPIGPFGSKGIGEMGMLPVCPAVANAYFDATGKRVRQLPCTSISGNRKGAPGWPGAPQKGVSGNMALPGAGRDGRKLPRFQEKPAFYHGI